MEDHISLSIRFGTDFQIGITLKDSIFPLLHLRLVGHVTGCYKTGEIRLINHKQRLQNHRTERRSLRLLRTGLQKKVFLT